MAPALKLVPVLGEGRETTLRAEKAMRLSDEI